MGVKKKTAAINLAATVPAIFQECQKSAANHRKYAIALRKIQEQVALDPPTAASQHNINYEGEAAFNKEVARNLNKILPIKRREPCADRIIRFVATFMLYTQEKDSKNKDDDQDMDEEETEGETISSRFTEFLMRHLLKGLSAKEKPVRLRCCELIALSINSLGEIDEDLYQKLKKNLLERVRDKETGVRVKAAIALSRMQGDEETGQDGQTVTKQLIDVLQHDPSSEVRRVVLYNLEHKRETLPYILERARDVDPINRRAVYLKPMSEIGDFKILSIQQREQLLKWGLTDRDPMVKKACSKMLTTNWIAHADNNLLAFLERLDVIESTAAEDVLMAFFNTRSDILNNMKFDEQFWDNLSIESAFLARVFIKYCQINEQDELLDRVIPEVTRHAFHIQRYNNLMVQAGDDTRTDYEFIVGQLLEMAKGLDYADEIGRRTMFTLLKEILMVPDIPDDHIASIVEIMMSISLGERDFTRIMIEIISDIRETIETDEAGIPRSFPSKDRDQDDEDDEDDEDSPASPATKRARTELSRAKREEQKEETERLSVETKLIQLKCLTICRYMLERSEENLHDNSSLSGLLYELIIPAVRSKVPTLTEEGVYCLGLYCMLDQALAFQNLELFMRCVRSSNEELQQKALMIVFDILMAYGYNVVIAKLPEPNLIPNMFATCLEQYEIPEMQAIAVEGISKLMLSKMLRDEELLKQLVLLYFDPDTADNLKLRQCLSYFLPMYCHSSQDNQVLMQKILVPTILSLIQTHHDLSKDQEMVAPPQIIQMMVDWTDPRRVVSSRLNPNVTIDLGLHAEVAVDVLKALFVETVATTRKLLVQILNKLYIDEAGEVRLKKLTLLAGNLKSRKPLTDAMTRNMFNKFEAALLKFFGNKPEALDDDEIGQAEEFKELLDFVESVEDEYVESFGATPARATRNRATKALALEKIEDVLDSSEDEEEDEEEEDDDDDDEKEQDEGQKKGQDEAYDEGQEEEQEEEQEDDDE